MDNSDIPLPSPPRPGARDTTRTRTARAARGSNNARPFNFRTHQLNFDKLSAPPSSDPPLFSSDDFQSSALENYSYAQTQAHVQDVAHQHPLRKRRYRGTWWGEQLHAHAHAKRKRRTQFKDKRYVDSGVWLGSDDSTGTGTDCPPTSDDAGFLADSGMVVRRHAGSKEASVPVLGVEDAAMQYEDSCIRPPVSVEPEPHARARAAIIRCLEDGDENVDLSYFNLQTIPPGLLRPLVQLTKEPLASEPPSTDDIYVPLEPFLQLFLTRNLLTTLPGEIFELERLRVLSLRHNKLTEIPSAIRNLTMLQDLNVAGNRLTHLPWEVLHLMQTGDLRQLTIHPNPFVELDDNDISQWHCHITANETAGTSNDSAKAIAKAIANGLDPPKRRLRAPEYTNDPPPEAWHPIRVATSKPQYLDMEGRPSQESHTTFPNPTILPTNSSASTVPSLRELALRACTRSAQLTRFLDPADPDDVLSYYPDPVFRLLTSAKRVRDAGGQQCSVCGRRFVIARTEWVEWWDCVPFESGSKSARKSGQDLYPVPFLRRGCSWGCGPEV